MDTKQKPRIGIVFGDVAGIGPELIAKLLADPETTEKARIVLIGDPRHWEAGIRIAKAAPPIPKEIESPEQIDSLDDDVLLLKLPTVDPASVELGRVSPKSGKAVLETVLFTINLIHDGKIDGFLFGPFNKEALHLGGSPYGSELELFKQHFKDNKGLEEINILDESWTMRVTSHIALKDVSAHLSVDGVHAAIRFLNEAMVAYGKDRPRIAVAALNPHNGEHGLFGDEEGRIIEPAVKKAKADGFDVSGPFPSDTVFIKLRDGVYDGVIAMYHDQCQIATKLLGFHRGVTYHAGFPVPITTPAHGTAFDIAGAGTAQVGATRHAFNVVCRIATLAMQGK